MHPACSGVRMYRRLMTEPRLRRIDSPSMDYFSIRAGHPIISRSALVVMHLHDHHDVSAQTKEREEQPD